MIELVKYVVTELVDKKDMVEVTEKEESSKVTVLYVAVDKDDIGRVIGKNGKIANALRAIVKSASMKSGKRFIVKIGERD